MSSEFGEKIRKNNENSEKYFGKFGKILKIRKNTRKKGPHSNSGKKFRKIQKIRKNTLQNSEKILWKIRKNTLENSEKYFEKIGNILLKIRKNTFTNQDPGRKITFSDNGWKVLKSYLADFHLNSTPHVPRSFLNNDTILGWQKN